MFTMSAIEMDQERRNHQNRRDLSRLCEVAFDIRVHQIPQNLQAVSDQAIEILCCTPWLFGTKCCVGNSLLIDNVTRQGRQPLIVFQNKYFANTPLLACIKQGQCLCSNEEKEYLTFLPACAAAAAGNLELCRSLIWSFYRPDINQEKGLERSTAELTLLELFEQVVHHLVYFGHGEGALRILEDNEINDTVPITNCSKLSLMKTAVERRHHNTFLMFVDRFGVNISGSDYGPTPLYLAVDKGTVQMARDLMRKGADRQTNCRRITNGMNILKVAILRSESDEMPIMLLEEGLGQSGAQELFKPSPLQLAMKHDRYALVDYLLQKGQATVPIDGSSTARAPAIAWCCIHNQQAMARYLVQRGLDCVSPIPLADGDAATPLHAIAAYSYADLGLIELLIKRGADVNEKMKNGDTPLSLAMRIRNIKTVKTLLFLGAILDSLTLTDTDHDIDEDRKEGKYSFLWYAVERQQYNMAEMALAAGYRARREPWFVKGDFPKHPPQDVIEKLERLSLQPLSLKCLSRKALKEGVGSSLLTYLDQANLGSTFNDDILLKDLVRTYKIR